MVTPSQSLMDLSGWQWLPPWFKLVGPFSVDTLLQHTFLPVGWYGADHGRKLLRRLQRRDRQLAV
jgi:hypothetical protein